MTAHAISWAPYLPWSVIGLLGLVAFALCIWAFYRQAGGTALRGLTFAILLLILANPSLVIEERDPISDIVVVISDRSQSQSIKDRPEQTDQATAHILAELEALENTDTHLIEVKTGSLQEEADGTRLFTALRGRLRSLPRDRIAGVIVISDGQVHDVPADFQELGIEAPFHLLLTGDEEERDRRLLVSDAPNFAIIGKPVTVTFTVEDQSPEGERGAFANVVLRQDGRLLEQRQVPFDVPQEFEVTLTRRGNSLIEIEVEAGPNELSIVNNRAAVIMNGVRDRLRVLLVSGEPHPGERAWRNILKSDPSVDLVHFTILRPPEKQDGTPIHELSLIAFPTRELFEIKLHEFDLVIFDRYRRRGVLPSIYLDNIARYVEQGGALLEAVGPTFATPLSIYRTPLGRVLPGEPTGEVFQEGFRPRITEIGLRHPVTRPLEAAGEAENWGRWFRQVGVTVDNGNVLMDGIGEHPLLILSRVGEGRVAQILSDHMWLWSRGFEGGGPQTEMLRRISHWLMKEPELEEEVLRAVVENGTLKIERRSLSQEVLQVEVTRPNGERELVDLESSAPGVLEGTLPAEELGLYHVSDGDLTALTSAGPLNPKEFDDLRADDRLLRPIIQASRGAVLKLASKDLPSLRKVRAGRALSGTGWLGIEAKGRYVVTGITQTSLLPAFLVLLAALVAMLFGWYREGR